MGNGQLVAGLDFLEALKDSFLPRLARINSFNWEGDGPSCLYWHPPSIFLSILPFWGSASPTSCLTPTKDVISQFSRAGHGIDFYLDLSS